jgi:protein-tyrosine phosphatase
VHAFREPAWEGARNAADLGGLPLVDGGTTVGGRVWRSAAPEWMTSAGWEAARAAGLSRVIDLRNEVECGRRPYHPIIEEEAMGNVIMVRTPTEEPDDPDFLEECGPWLDHPRSWAPNARRYPEKFADVFRAIAADGPVLIHCAGGRDRTGMICAMLLSLAGVEHAAIAADYEQGFRKAGGHRGHGLAYDPGVGEWTETSGSQPWSPAELDKAMADRIPVLMEWLASTDVEAYLLAAGLDAADLTRVRRKLRE